MNTIASSSGCKLIGISFPSKLIGIFSFEEHTVKFGTFVAAPAFGDREVVVGFPMGLVQVRFVRGEVNQKEEGSARLHGRLLRVGS